MKKFVPLLLLALLVCGVYAPAVRNGFVWDDTALILRDPLIRSWRLIPEGFQHFLFTDATASDFYRPIQRLTYTAEYAAFGFNAAAYHLTSVLCHLGAAIALLLFARELLRACGADEAARKIVPTIAAMIWALHPIHSSAVVYIAGRADPLAAAFGFGGLAVGLVSLRSTSLRVWGLTALATILFLLSALSKEAGLVFLALWLAVVLAQRKVGAPALGLIGVVLVSYLTLRLPAHHIEPPASSATPALVRPVLIARAVAEYAQLIALPTTLRMERDVETRTSGPGVVRIEAASLRELQTLAGIILAAAFIYWLLRARRRDKAVFVALLLCAISYLPVSGLVPLNATVAEHWLYLPTAFLFLAATLSGFHFVRASSRLQLRRVALPALALWMASLGGRTFVRTFDWKDQRTFLERTIADGGDSARMLINLGSLEMNENRLALAKKHLDAALQKEPEQPFAIINLAAVALKQDDFATARDLLGRATKIPLVEPRAHEMLAVLEYKETGRANLLRMRLAARTGPPDWSIEKRYVNVLAESGATEAALHELKHCLATEWYRADSWRLLAELAAQTGHEAEARAAFARAESYDVRLHERLGAL